MEPTSIIIAGTGIIQSLLLLLLQPTDEQMSEQAKKDYENFMKMMEGVSRTQRTKELIQFVADDKFGDSVYTNSENWSYLAELKGVKEKFVKFYFSKIKDIELNYKDLDIVADIDESLGQFAIQLMRLRLVIQPEVQISTNVHPRTNIKYLAIKAYWCDDNGKKIRKFTKSIGRADNYPKGIEDRKAMTDGVKLIQPVIFETYQEIYKK